MIILGIFAQGQHHPILINKMYRIQRNIKLLDNIGFAYDLKHHKRVKDRLVNLNNNTFKQNIY